MEQLGRWAHTFDFTTWTYLLVSNLFIFFQEAALWMGFDPSSGELFYTANWQETAKPYVWGFLLLPAAWSISIELQFYLVAPFILRNWKRVAIIAIISLAVRWYVCHIGYCQDPWTYRFFPSELIFFLMGYASYKLYKYIQHRNTLVSWGWVVLGMVVLLAIIQERNPFQYKNEVFVVTVMLAIPFIFKTTKNIKWDNQIGEISYPVYIVHLFIIFLLYRFGPSLVSGTDAAIVSVLVSVVLIKFVSDPIEKIRQERVRKIVTV